MFNLRAQRPSSSAWSLAASRGSRLDSRHSFPGRPGSVWGSAGAEADNWRSWGLPRPDSPHPQVQTHSICSAARECWQPRGPNASLPASSSGLGSAVLPIPTPTPTHPPTAEAEPLPSAREQLFLELQGMGGKEGRASLNPLRK